MKIWLDDEFPPFKKHFLFPPRDMPEPELDWVWAKSAHDAMELISLGEPIEAFAVDNDLGLRSAEGIELLRELLKQSMEDSTVKVRFAQTKFYPITNNSARAEEMRRLIAELQNNGDC